MIVLYSKKFRKNYRKLIPKIREKFKERRDIFLANPFDQALNNHLLHDPYAGYRSINITGDYRAIYYQESVECVRFIAIGTHHELFGS